MPLAVTMKRHKNFISYILYKIIRIVPPNQSPKMIWFKSNTHRVCCTQRMMYTWRSPNRCPHDKFRKQLIIHNIFFHTLRPPRKQVRHEYDRQ